MKAGSHLDIVNQAYFLAHPKNRKKKYGTDNKAYTKNSVII